MTSPFTDTEILSGREFHYIKDMPGQAAMPASRLRRRMMELQDQGLGEFRRREKWDGNTGTKDIWWHFKVNPELQAGVDRLKAYELEAQF